MKMSRKMLDSSMCPAWELGFLWWPRSALGPHPSLPLAWPWLPLRALAVLVPWSPGPAVRIQAGCRGALCRRWRQAGPGVPVRQQSGNLNSALSLGDAALLVVPMGFTPNAVLHNSIRWWLLWT